MIHVKQWQQAGVITRRLIHVKHWTMQHGLEMSHD
jgi:hypothetical protein